MYEQLPNTKNLYELCEGISISQQQGDLVKEKQLFDLLVLLYRSPDALLKVTGTDVQYVDDESDSKPSGANTQFDRDSGSSVTSPGRGGAKNEGGSDDRSVHSKQD